MPHSRIAIVSIRDEKNGVLACDVRDVLEALTPYLHRWVWCITDLDAFAQGGADGQAVEEMCRDVERAGPKGVWRSSRELQDFAGRIAQTIDGTFVAFPAGTVVTHLDESSLSLAAFLDSAAELAIQVVDSSFIDVYAKDLEIPALLSNHFIDVREEDPHLYFADR